MKFLMMTMMASLIAMVVCMIISMVQTSRRGSAHRTLAVLVHVFGILTVGLNMVRCILLYDADQNTMIFANLVVCISLIVSLVRLRKRPGKSEGQSEEKN